MRSIEELPHERPSDRLTSARRLLQEDATLGLGATLIIEARAEAARGDTALLDLLRSEIPQWFTDRRTARR